MSAMLYYKKLSPRAFAPTKGTVTSAGYDLKSAYEYVVEARGQKLIKTDLRFEFPKNCYGRIAPRSGLASNNSIDVGGGVIDPDFTGDVRVILFNHGSTDFKVKPGDRIAQLILEKFCNAELVETEVMPNKTERGTAGFGSTGISQVLPKVPKT